MSLLFIVDGILFSVNVMSVLIYVISPPPFLCCLSVRIAVYPFSLGVFDVVFSFVSCMVIMSIFSLSATVFNSSILVFSPFMLSCRMLRFFLGLCRGRAVLGCLWGRVGLVRLLLLWSVRLLSGVRHLPHVQFLL